MFALRSEMQISQITAENPPTDRNYAFTAKQLHSTSLYLKFLPS